MKKYLQYIFDSMNEQYSVEWKKINNDLIGYFNSSENKYRILIIEKPLNTYLIKFQVLVNNKWSFKSKSSNNLLKESLTVFSTLEKEYSKFIEQNSPNGIIFFSVEPGNRNNIYLRYCSNVKYKFKDYNYTIVDISNYNCFFIYKSMFNQEQLEIILKDIKEENYNYDEFD